MANKDNKKRRKKKQKVVPPKRPRGRPRVNVSFVEARELVRAEALGSKTEYDRWWLYNRPTMIPKRPDRAYKKEWTNWNDFLGNNNPYPWIKRKYRSFKEARAWARNLGLKTLAEWAEYTRRPDFPNDVPKRPDYYYRKSNEWFTWPDFLGTKVKDRIGSLKETDHIIYLIKYNELPLNVYTVGVTNEGLSSILHRQQQYGFQIIKLFYHDKESDWLAKIKKYIRPYHVGNGNFIIDNIYDVIGELSLSYLEIK